MDTSVLEYKCPCCDGRLPFDGASQKMKCPYCDTEFDLEAILEYNEAQQDEEEITWEEDTSRQWSEDEAEHLHSFICSACGGELITDEQTAATFCPYCDNPAILPGRVSGGLKPDSVIPFRKTREDARQAFMELCKKKPLLPKEFTQEHRLEKISGIYVPFWLYDCQGHFSGQYKATRVHHWSDARYCYTRTEHFMLKRGADAAFARIPMDGSSKMDDAIMESIEPFDYSQMVDFETAYLSGFLADKYDVASVQGQQRIRDRVSASMESMVRSSIVSYATVIPTARNLKLDHSKASYVLLPVWMLHTKYRGKSYVFAMNGQTGKMTGTFPICYKRAAVWFAGIFAGVTAVMNLILNLIG